MLSLVSIASVSSLWISLAQVGNISFKCFYIHGVNVFPWGYVNQEKQEICHKSPAGPSEEQCFLQQILFLIRQSPTSAGLKEPNAFMTV